jgi:hypothetical protein
MAKIEISLTEDEKRKLKAAADKSQLRLATWAKARLLLAAMTQEGNA